MEGRGLVSEPLVSVIIAVKNGERFLPSAIESVLEQHYRPIEMIVVDGQSVDGTARIARRFKEVRYIYQKSGGVADAYNIGIDAARGELVAFLSHDDVWTRGKLAIQVKYLKDHPEIQYTVGKVRFFLENGQPIPHGFRRHLLRDEHVGHIMETFMARKSLFDWVGKFNPALTSAEDVDWFGRANDQGVPMVVIPQVLLHKRVHENNLSLTSSANNRNLLKAVKNSIDRKHRQEPRR
jgi:glycosyltransferase involved in cell wall biosynthesis